MSLGGFQCLERVGDSCLKDISLFLFERCQKVISIT